MAQEHDASQESDGDMDCSWAVLLGIRMGLDVETIMRMRYGEFADLLITQAEMRNVKKNAVKEERRGSVMDL